mmetsp:Transcript_17411/g.17138  ORF Transcript_17411/g.17138 Transcript_17411/m.17138 type:complete len:120 (-) Transcript_17411:59-418(-)
MILKPEFCDKYTKRIETLSEDLEKLSKVKKKRGSLKRKDLRSDTSVENVADKITAIKGELKILKEAMEIYEVLEKKYTDHLFESKASQIETEEVRKQTEGLLVKEDKLNMSDRMSDDSV